MLYSWVKNRSLVTKSMLLEFFLNLYPETTFRGIDHMSLTKMWGTQDIAPHVPAGLCPSITKIDHL